MRAPSPVAALWLAVAASFSLAGCGCDEELPPEAQPPWERLEPCRLTVTVPADPEARIQVQMTLPADAPEPLRLYTASAAVGAYAPCDFTPFIHGVAAKNEAGAPLAVARSADKSWTIAGRPRTVSWEVDAAAGERAIEDLNVSTHRRPEYTLLSGYATFLVAKGLEEHPHHVTLPLHGGEWPAESVLTRHAGGIWHARSALDLLDEPIAMGRAIMMAHVDSPIQAWVHVWSESADLPIAQVATLAAATKDALRAVEALQAPPFDPRRGPSGDRERPYHVFFELRKPVPARDLGWALEHGNSFQAVDEINALDKATPGLVYHLAHHMLHAWIPRRLYTDALQPMRQLRGRPTRAIWFAEGFAQYLAFVGMAKAGVAETPVVLQMLARRFATPYTKMAPETRRSMTERSLELSTGKHDEWFFGFAEGALLAMWLDEQLRAQKPDGDGLPGAMRALAAAWPELDSEGHAGPGIPEDQFEAAFAKASGLDVAEVFARHVRGTDPLPLDQILDAAGIVRSDKGFRALAPDALTPAQAAFRTHAFR